MPVPSRQHSGFLLTGLSPKHACEATFKSPGEIYTPTLEEWSSGRFFTGSFGTLKRPVPAIQIGWIACHGNPVMYVDPDGMFYEPYLDTKRIPFYSAAAGIEAHKVFQRWIEKYHPELEAEKRLTSFGSSMRPDVVSEREELVWELKPVSHFALKFDALDNLQLSMYMKITGYKPGAPTELVPTEIRMEEPVIVGNKQYVMYVQPANKPGFIYYSLREIQGIKRPYKLLSPDPVVKRLFELGLLSSMLYETFKSCPSMTELPSVRFMPVFIPVTPELRIRYPWLFPSEQQGT